MVFAELSLSRVYSEGAKTVIDWFERIILPRFDADSVSGIDDLDDDDWGDEISFEVPRREK
jgi:hypothetical protein